MIYPAAALTRTAAAGFVPAAHDLFVSSGPKSQRKSGRRIERICRAVLAQTLIAFPAAIVSFFALSMPAHADLKICNRMSYVVDAAVGIDEKGVIATRGWFRIDPAMCRVVLPGPLTADRLLLNARALGVYGASPIPQNGSDRLCVAPDDFVIADAHQCRDGQTSVPFTPINPSQAEDGNVAAYLAEDSEYDDDQAKLAAIQRLLVIAGYDAAPIDGVDGPKTQAALAAFLKNRGLSADIVQAPNLFDTAIRMVPRARACRFSSVTSREVPASTPARADSRPFTALSIGTMA